MNKDQWERFRRVGELPMIHKRSLTRSFGFAITVGLSSWIVFQPPGMTREEAAQYVTLPSVVVVGKRELTEPLAKSNGSLSARAVNVIAQESLR